ncbi:hypothetical protein CWI36_2706p0010, partial [Hamiltosporidium magnivora]
FDIFKSGKYIKRISSTVKPTLTDKNKIDRLKFCLSKVNPANNEDLLFDNLYDYKTIYLQQDNAKPYFSDNDADIVALASPHTIAELTNCVQDAFHKLEANTLDNVFTTLQACMESIMLADGGNGYKIPHLSKGKPRRESQLL